MQKFFSENFVGGLKRQAFIKGLDLLIDALIDFKQNYQNKTKSTTTSVPQNDINPHL